jgi:hypothetical protein
VLRHLGTNPEDCSILDADALPAINPEDGRILDARAPPTIIARLQPVGFSYDTRAVAVQ